MKKRAKNIWIGCSIAASGIAAIMAASYSTTKKLLKIAMEREIPNGIHIGKNKLTGSPRSSEFLEEAAKATERLESSNCETVEITSHDGIRLVGHWYPCNNPKRIIIAMHGWRASWSQNFGQIADFWHDSDCSVLYAEQRGQGSSGGDYMGFGLLERYDCLDWIHWINMQTDCKLPIYLGGVSMGATTVLMTAGLDLPDNVHGIVADCGFTSPHAIWKHVMKNNLHIPYSGIHAAVASEICRKKMNIGTKDYSSTDAMRMCKVPVLFIHGTEDHFVPIEMTFENYKACTAPKRLFVVPGAEHGMSYYTNKTAYENTIKKFWADYDHITITPDICKG